LRPWVIYSTRDSRHTVRDSGLTRTGILVD